MDEIKDVNGISFDNIVFVTTLKHLRLGTPLIIHQGGTFSGKTFNILLAFLYFFWENQDAGFTLSVISSSFPQLRRGALKDWKSIVTKLPWYITSALEGIHTYKIGSNTVEFFSTSDDKNAIEKVTQGKRHYAFMDEANLIDWAPADLVIGKSTKATVLAYNPYSEFWLHEMILPYWSSDKYLFWISTFIDNKHVEENTKNWLELKRLNDPDSYRILAEGKLGQGKGMIFTNVRYVTELPSKKDAVYYYGLDFGYTNDVTALAAACLYQGEIWAKQIFYEKGYGKKEIIEAMFEAQITERETIVCDKDFTMKTELRNAGFNVVFADKPPGSVIQGIDMLKQYRINILVSSIDWKREQIGYRYKEKNGKTLNEPIENSDRDHLWDGLRYLSQKMLVNKRPFTRKIVSIR